MHPPDQAVLLIELDRLALTSVPHGRERALKSNVLLRCLVELDFSPLELLVRGFHEASTARSQCSGSARVLESSRRG